MDHSGPLNQTARSLRGLSASAAAVCLLTGTGDTRAQSTLDSSTEFTRTLKGAIPTDLAVTEKGWVYLVGTTTSPDYPVTADAYDTTCGTDGRCNPTQGRFGIELRADHVLTVFDPRGTIHYSTFLGGSSQDDNVRLAVASDGTVWIAGATTSRDFEHQTNTRGCTGIGGTAVWVGRFDMALRTLRDFQCLVPGAAIADLVVDGDGHAWVLGTTASTALPVQNAFQPRLAGQFDMFVAELSPGSLTPRLATYIGGNSLDSADAVIVTRDGVAITGSTLSTDFPVVRPFKGTLTGPFPRRDAVVTSLDRSGRFLQFSTYFGSTGDDLGRGLATDAVGNIFVTGMTSSSDLPMSADALDPRCGTDARCNASFDAFVAKFSPTGSWLASTYLGGTGLDYGRRLSFLASGSLLVAGSTQAADFPLLGALPTRSAPFVNFEAGFLTVMDGNLQRLARSTLVADDGYQAPLQAFTHARDYIYIAGQIRIDNAPGTYLRKFWRFQP